MLSSQLVRTLKYCRFKIGQYIGELGGGMFLLIISNIQQDWKDMAQS
jgi:hypothetical protein